MIFMDDNVCSQGRLNRCEFLFSKILFTRPYLKNKAMDTEEDLYNEIFKALKHPVRRHILSLLHDEPQSYSSILRALNIDTGLLNYHLENLGSLIAKNEEGKYGVSEFGRAAIKLKDGIEAPQRGEPHKPQTKQREIFILGFMLVSLIILGSYAYEQRQLYLREVEWDETLLTKILMTEQDRLTRIESTLDEIINNRSINASHIEELSMEAEHASFHYARIVYVDEPHLELWLGVSEVFRLLDNLLTDMKVYTYSGSNVSIPLDDTGVEKIQIMKDRIGELDQSLFPVYISREVNPWKDDSYSEANDALNAVESLKVSIAQSWVILSRVNVALSPEEQASAMLIGAVGQDYYDACLRFRDVSVNVAYGDWLTRVDYDYLVSGDDYNYTCEIQFYFDKFNGLLRSSGIPIAGNLMPFTVNRTEALDSAKSVSRREVIEEEVRIFWLRELSDGEPLGKYVWIVDLYHNHRDEDNGSLTRSIIDPLNGEMLENNIINWLSTS